MIKVVNNQVISDLDDDDEYYDDNLLEPALAVPEDPDDHHVSVEDTSVPPTSGSEYLRRVRAEAKRCPKVVAAKIDSSVLRQPPTIRYQHKDTMAAPHGYGPTAAWIKMQVADFVTLRQRVVRFKALLNKNKISLPQVQLPDAADTDNWCRLCFGRLRLKNAAAGHVKGPADDERGTADQSDNTCGAPPLLSLVARMSQPTLMKVLEYHVNWLEATGFTRRQGQWFYALLANLQKPLTPEMCSLLRQLAKLCSIIRLSVKSPEDSIILELNLMICLVAHYFDQGDLADKT